MDVAAAAVYIWIPDRRSVEKPMLSLPDIASAHASMVEPHVCVILIEIACLDNSVHWADILLKVVCLYSELHPKTLRAVAGCLQPSVPSDWSARRKLTFLSWKGKFVPAQHSNVISRAENPGRPGSRQDTPISNCRHPQSLLALSQRTTTQPHSYTHNPSHKDAFLTTPRDREA